MEVSASISNIEDVDSKLDALTTEYWHNYSTGWKNLIMSVYKNVFGVNNQNPHFGLKAAYSNRKLYDENQISLADSFHELIKNWEDIFGANYYQHAGSLVDFVQRDTISILNLLFPYVEEHSVLEECIEQYRIAWEFET